MSRTAKEIETTGLPCEAQNGETIQVVPKIDVTMFGKFTLKQEGMEVHMLIKTLLLSLQVGYHHNLNFI